MVAEIGLISARRISSANHKSLSVDDTDTAPPLLTRQSAGRQPGLSCFLGAIFFVIALAYATVANRRLCAVSVSAGVGLFSVRVSRGHGRCVEIAVS